MKIGFIGLGIMGNPMCKNIVKKHQDTVYAFDRNEDKLADVVNAGATACTSALEIAEKSDIFITMIQKSDYVFAVYEEIKSVLKKNKIWIDMSTIDPGVSIQISDLVKETGARFADAPVVKSQPAAVAGKLGIYVGSDEQTYEEIKPILAYMGENVIRMGKNGMGLVMKVCHNALVSQIQNGVNETITLAEKNGISVQKFATAISYGGGQNFYLDSKKNVLEKGDFTTAFSVENMAKDIAICLNLAKEENIYLPGEENVAEVYAKALEKGFGKEDFSATIKVVKERAN